MCDRIPALQALCLLCAGAVLGLAIMPDPASIPGISSDKSLHILAFMALTLLARFAWRRPGSLLIFVTLAGFGGLIELVQNVPSLERDASFYDWMVDLAAILAMLGLIAAMRGARTSHYDGSRP